MKFGLKNIALTLGLLAFAALGLNLLFASGPPVRAADDGSFSAAQEEAIGRIVRSYILEHPEVIPEAIAELQKREVARMIESNRDAIETPFKGAWAGSEDAEVVLVEFFDYACPYCRRSNEDVQRLLEEVDDLKVVWRDMPVLGAPSRQAAEASLAAASQDKFRAYHDAMFADERRVGQEKTFATIRRAGLSEERAARDMKSDAVEEEINKNLALARALGVSGTPAYVIGDQVVDGAAGYEALKAAVDAARDGG